MCFNVCILLLVASGAFASQICFPDQYEGISGSTVGYNDGNVNGLTRAFSSFHYDYTNSRLVVYDTTETAGGTTKELTVFLYSGGTGTQYVLDLDTNKCVASPLSVPLKKRCLPDGSSYVGQGDLGPAGILPVLFYTAKMETITVEAAITKHGNDYLPVNVAVYGNVFGVNAFSGTGYYNMTTGINNPSVFDIPKGCKKTNMPQKRSASLFGF